ncbi:MAG: thiamine pyrophosphate-binding protein, partial [Pseudonocardiaceae bacterium]|nr:thiamine pyrophosphate-binding protein [Pseudonocardiaceae bacterium]
MHASMAIYNAYCDRVPMLILGATGPLDAVARRPWIDWIHTAADQAALVRPFLKWDDQPGSVPAAVESLNRAWHITMTPPCAPVYVCLDAELQERELAEGAVTGELIARPAGASRASAESARRAANALRSARRPVLLAGRVSRDPAEWKRRVELAELLGAHVITDLKAGAAFPTDHPLSVPGPGYFLSQAAADVLARADCVLSLDWIDLAGTIRTAAKIGPLPEVISVSLDA